MVSHRICQILTQKTVDPNDNLVSGAAVLLNSTPGTIEKNAFHSFIPDISVA